MVQIRPYMPEEIRSIEWLALGSNVFNTMIPKSRRLSATARPSINFAEDFPPRALWIRNPNT